MNTMHGQRELLLHTEEVLKKEITKSLETELGKK